MPLIKWTDDLSVGVKIFDQHHMKLVDLLNSLHSAMMLGKGAEILTPILNSLVVYTRNHFEAEEKMMRLHNYPDLDAHIVQHRELTRQVEEFQAKYSSGKQALSVQVMDFLKEWLTNHIKGTDQKYTKHLNGRGVS